MRLNKRYLMNIDECKHSLTSDFSFRPIHVDLSEPKTVHIYCYDCGMHEFDGLIFTAEEWEEWINEPE